jgi:hypothetical protein
MKTAYEMLYELWGYTRQENSSLDYINELCNQIQLFGTESNKLTREMVLGRLERICEDIRTTLAN